MPHGSGAYNATSAWEALGASERRYYKLLSKFAPKNGPRYEVDASVLEQIRTHLIRRDQETKSTPPAWTCSSSEDSAMPPR